MPLVVRIRLPMPETHEVWVRSLGREDSPGEGNGNPLHSCLGNPMDRGAWQSMELQRIDIEDYIR